MMAFVLILQTPAGSSVSQAMNSLFALDSVQMWWYVTRAAGLTGYFLMWLSMAWGLAIANKSFIWLSKVRLLMTSMISIVIGNRFILLHVIVLLLTVFFRSMLSRRSSHSSMHIVPSGGTRNYRLLSILIGGCEFYMRKTIGMQAFRSITL